MEMLVCRKMTLSKVTSDTCDTTIRSEIMLALTPRHVLSLTVNRTSPVCLVDTKRLSSRVQLSQVKVTLCPARTDNDTRSNLKLMKVIFALSASEMLRCSCSPPYPTSEPLSAIDNIVSLPEICSVLLIRSAVKQLLVTGDSEMTSPSSASFMASCSDVTMMTSPMALLPSPELL